MKRRYRARKIVNPPKMRVRKKGKTVRFCVVCGNVRHFEFDKLVKHSKCTVCGKRRSMQLTNEQRLWCMKKGWIRTKS